MLIFVVGKCEKRHESSNSNPHKDKRGLTLKLLKVEHHKYHHDATCVTQCNLQQTTMLMRITIIALNGSYGIRTTNIFPLNPMIIVTHDVTQRHFLHF